MSKNPKWQIIDEIAEGLGVEAEARRKWRTRGVAHKWRIGILEEAKRRRIRINVSDMEATQ